jgi:alpha-amylase
MPPRARLILTLHNHQPIGNFGGVFEAAYQDAYAPLLDVLDEFPEIPVVMHNSGCLFEWLAAEHPEYIERLRKIVQRGQAEILGGPFYEPILACIPRRDRIGQMQVYSRALEQTFGVPIRGMWVPERVWEQAFASDIVEAGIEYTLLDDAHFRNASVGDDRLHGYYLTENDGRVLKVFPGSERLRYLIPYADPCEVIHHCRSVADRFANPVLVFGDDGEKFGVWPGSKALVYGEHWLRRFFQVLRENQEWLKVTTMAEAVDHVSPLGTQYLPDASYREMTEWALPTDEQSHYRRIKHTVEQHGDWPQMRPFFRAGFWRNFLVKYPEAHEMYTRMLQVSQKLDDLSAALKPGLSEGPASRSHDARALQTGPSESPGLTLQRLHEARRHLYRGQCNCPYWHGAFGGLYLPHLRNAIYSQLIQADTLLEQAAGRTGRWVQIDADDFNCDARKELRLSSDRLVALLAPSQGGHLYELDLRTIRTNLLATLNRRPEPYHDRIRESAGQVQSASGGGVDPNGGVSFKQPDLDQHLHYDQWPRKSLVDHFLQPGLSFDGFATGGGHTGDFATGVYQSLLRRSSARIEAKQWRDGKLGPYAIRVTKTVALATSHTGQLEIEYLLERLPPELPIHFGIEFNFAAMAGGANDRFYYNEDGGRLGLLDARQDLGRTARLGLVDEWLGLDVALETSVPCGFWTLPIQTVSQSEGGFELVHQSCAVVPHWEFIAPADGRWSVQLTLSLDTSAAQAKQLADAPPPQLVGGRS